MEQPSKLWVLGSNPNRITTKAKAQPLWLRFFVIWRTVKSLLLNGTAYNEKNAVLRTQDALSLWSMMARGGRENGAQRRNPHITLNAILDI